MRHVVLLAALVVAGSSGPVALADGFSEFNADAHTSPEGLPVVGLPPVPEPGTAALLALGLVVLGLQRRALR